MSQSGDGNAPDKELSIPGEDKRLDSKEDGTADSPVVRLSIDGLSPIPHSMSLVAN